MSAARVAADNDVGAAPGLAHEVQSVLDEGLAWLVVRELAADLRARLAAGPGDVERARIVREYAGAVRRELVPLDGREAVAVRELMLAFAGG